MPISHRLRTVLRLSGEGVADWLGNLLTNTLTAPVTFAALLTPQGKIIADLFVTDRGDHLLIDTTPDMGAPLFKRLKMYRLRAPIEIEDVSETHFVHTIWDEADETRGHADPRLPALGRRWITDTPQPSTGDYDRHRLALGVPDSEWDFGSAATFPMDAGMDILSGVNYSKGCFVGQEVVSRMKRKSIVRKRMKALRLSGPAEPGDSVMIDERKVGQVLHVNGDLAMALIRVDKLGEGDDFLNVRGSGAGMIKTVFDPLDREGGA